jgi:hypothetical protein
VCVVESQHPPPFSFSEHIHMTLFAFIIDGMWHILYSIFYIHAHAHRSSAFGFYCCMLHNILIHGINVKTTLANVSPMLVFERLWLG